MPNYQEGIFTDNANCFNVSEYKLVENDLTKIRKAIHTVLERKAENINVVVSFGKKLWSMLSDFTLGKFNDFSTLEGKNGHQMPSTQADLYFRVLGTDQSSVLDATLQIEDILKDIFEVVLSENGFVYKDNRDLTGFVDGSANPKEEQKYLAALIPANEIGANGSFVFHQKWVHDLDKFNQLPVAVQEKIIGRTKEDSIELEGDDMPENSHVSRTDAKHDGVAMKIWRRSFPYGSALEKGLFFIAYTCDPFRVDIQLERMLGNTEDKVSDRIMEFSTAVSGGYSFAPSVEDLEKALTIH
ncbi:Dyp-type peroxidase [Flammeovirga sp. EKP202]|uniref:Dyp-type peroxidase n=1 Tax=Flammeovirga sp. EKP202 TaxID=2770592 RepID=UPI00165F47BF|nr:Dyp-type peroxidase [Flammeovirga sp. EKP202]MBD0403836.1 Dyp-type peroxidase [Flammeovirga sp. EKP202]